MQTISYNSKKISRGLRSKRMYVIFVPLLIVVGAVSYFGYQHYVKKPVYKQNFAVSVSKQFTAKITAGDMKGAYAMTSDAFKKNNTIDAFSASYKDLKNDHANYNYINAKAADTSTSVQYAVSSVENYPSKAIYRSTIRVAKQGNKTVVDGINIKVISDKS